MNTISDKIKFLRISHNYTQTQLAKELFVSRQTVSHWETGQNIPTTDSLQAVCRLFQVELSFFSDGDICLIQSPAEAAVSTQPDKRHKLTGLKISVVILGVLLAALITAAIAVYAVCFGKTPDGADETVGSFVIDYNAGLISCMILCIILAIAFFTLLIVLIKKTKFDADFQKNKK